MRTIRLPLSPLPEENQVVALPPEAVRYLSTVLRLRAGARFVAFDRRTRMEADGELLEGGASFGPARPGVVADAPALLLQGWAKGDKNESVLQDATELGASHVLFFAAARSVAKVEEGKKRAAKEERLMAVAEGAARQSGRADVPVVTTPVPLTEALAEAAAVAEQRFVLVPTAERSLGTEWVHHAHESVAFLVGPEGGLAPEEIALAETFGFVPVSLGAYVLRCETVAAALLGALRVLRTDPRAPAKLR